VSGFSRWIQLSPIQENFDRWIFGKFSAEYDRKKGSYGLFNLQGIPENHIILDLLLLKNVKTFRLLSWKTADVTLSLVQFAKLSCAGQQKARDGDLKEKATQVEVASATSWWELSVRQIVTIAIDSLLVILFGKKNSTFTCKVFEKLLKRNKFTRN
jgi:hypothetical protein